MRIIFIDEATNCEPDAFSVGRLVWCGITEYLIHDLLHFESVSLEKGIGHVYRIVSYIFLSSVKKSLAEFRVGDFWNHLELLDACAFVERPVLFFEHGK